MTLASSTLQIRSHEYSGHLNIVIFTGAFIRRTLIYKFKEQLQEGMVFRISSFDFACKSGSYRPSHIEYKLNFTINTKVKISKSSLVPTNMYLHCI
ncbi:DUF223 domain protein [Medicago truncatula]|uniref:DUF223 domain protein n=1 Tax=Medicago truncatula TaxID=3880 RepID=G7L3H8_MEDTR|nr:DUF223 domain protein [Medicago truncatula]